MKAIIFDLDGTLINTLQDIADAANEVLHRHGYPIYSVQEYKMLIGKGTNNLFEYTTQGALSETGLNLLVNEFKDSYAKCYNNKTYLYPGINELLEWLESMEITYAVLSNKPHTFVLKLVKEFFPNRKFSAVFGQRFNVPIKPDSTQTKEILSLLNCNPKDVILIGDTCIDILTAKNAALFAAGAAWGFRNREELLQCGADAILDSPADFQRMLSKRTSR